ncbi:MAG: UDP-2,3-diacylglucosamine diphosphatase [Steroidobacteraceae bacterium]
MTTLFTSDLHLDPREPEIVRQFIDFLDGEAREADALYVLGDLFEVWIGDDDPEPMARDVVAALRRLTDSGVPCRVMHGNRDFLLGRRFCAATGATLVPDGAIVELNGERVLLMHGDLLCTDDTSYQRLRRIVRNPVVQWAYLALSLERRRALAERMRAGSRMHTGSAAPEIMDVNAGAVAEAFRRNGVRTIVHGHTHRPAVHELVVDGTPARRIVLGDWHRAGSVLEWSGAGPRLRTLPRQ